MVLGGFFTKLLIATIILDKAHIQEKKQLLYHDHVIQLYNLNIFFTSK